MNSIQKDITTEDIQQIDGMKNLPVDEVQKILESVKEFSMILQLIPSADKCIQK